MSNYTPFFPDDQSGISYTVSGLKPKTNNTTFYDSKDLYETQALADDRAYNIGCSGHRRVLVNASGQYKFAPCSSPDDYKAIMKSMPKIPVDRRYYEYDPTENIYDIRDIQSFYQCTYPSFILSNKLNLSTIIATELSEYVYQKDKQKSIDYVLHQFSQNKPVLICGHNPYLSKYFKKIVGKKWAKKFKEELDPGEAWVIYRFNSKVIRINLMQSPEV